MKKTFKFFLPFLFVSLLISNTYFYSMADAEACQVKNATYQINLVTTTLDVTRSVQDIGTAGLFSAFAATLGTDTDTFLGCGDVIASMVGASDAISAVCDGASEEQCSALTSNVTDDGASYVGTSLANVYTRGVRGSLLGVAGLLEGVVVNEALPVNFAYYWNQSISKLPFANKALAADLGSNYANMPVISGVYSFWKVARDVSLGLMAAVLLYTGIMIIMRKKVNAQLVVSVQYAIPKILIGIVLILFSYAIGAFLTYIGWGLFRGARGLVWDAFSDISETGKDVASGLLVIVFIVQLILFFVSSSGGTFLLILIGLALVVLVFHIIIWFKAFLIYLKMAFSIITAPLEMVLGTVPGSEGRIKDWFVRMGKYIITLWAIGLIIPITSALALSVALAYTTGASNMELGGLGVMISLLSPLLIIIIGYSIAIGIEKRIDEMFFSTKKR